MLVAIVLEARDSLVSYFRRTTGSSVKYSNARKDTVDVLWPLVTSASQPR